MNHKDTGDQAAILEKPVDSRQIHVVVDGCTVKLNFPDVPENSALIDVKRMMLGGVVK